MMRISDIGERDFLRKISAFVRVPQDAVLQWDDDASDIPLDSERHVVINVDTLVGSTDRLPGMSAAQIGRKVAVMTLSDLVAKGVQPTMMMLSLSVPPDTNQEESLEIVRGASQYCLKNGVQLIGGDTGLADDLVVTGVAIGTAHPAEIVPRSGAKPGDIVAVSGRFGLTSVAFKMLLEGLEPPPSLAQRALIAAYKPVIDYDLIRRLRSASAVTSSMDSSDGLAVTLNAISEHSNVRLEIERIPMAPGVADFASANGLDAMDLVFGGGEEFALVFTVPPEKWDDAVEISRQSTFGMTRIGRVTQGRGVVLLGEAGSNPVPIPPRGYDSFREWS